MWIITLTVTLRRRERLQIILSKKRKKEERIMNVLNDKISYYEWRNATQPILLLSFLRKARCSVQSKFRTFLREHRVDRHRYRLCRHLKSYKRENAKVIYISNNIVTHNVTAAYKKRDFVYQQSKWNNTF